MEKLENTTFGISKIDSKNRVTIPSEALDFLKVSNGYYVSFNLYNNALILHKAYFVIRRNNNGDGEKK